MVEPPKCHFIARTRSFHNERAVIAARLIADPGVLRNPWFLFDKRLSPMLQVSRNDLYNLYIDTADLSHAVIYDIDFAKSLYRAAGLTIPRVEPPNQPRLEWLIHAHRGHLLGAVGFLAAA